MSLAGRSAASQIDLTPLVAALGDDVVLVDPDRMAGYRWDRANDPDAGIPLAVVRAGSTEDVQAAVRFAAEHGLAVVPRGAGSGLSGGVVRRRRLPGGLDRADDAHRGRPGDPHRRWPSPAP